jgi:hypothetical protein
LLVSDALDSQVQNSGLICNLKRTMGYKPVCHIN